MKAHKKANVYILSERKKMGTVPSKDQKLEIYKQKRKTMTGQQAYLQPSPSRSDPLQGDKHHLRRIFLCQPEQHPRHLEGQGWCHRRRAHQFLRSK